MPTKPPFGCRLDTNSPINNGLISAWIFNEAAGITCYDLTPQRNNLTSKSANPWAKSDNGPAITLNGISDYLDMTSPTALWGCQNEFSIFARVKSSGVNLSSCLLEIGPTGYAFNCSSLGLKLNLGLISASATIGPTGFYTVAASYNGSAKTIELFINGLSLGKTVVSGYTPSLPFLGGRVGAPLGTTISALTYFVGTVDCLYIWRRAINPQEVLKLNDSPYCVINKPLKVLVSKPPTITVSPSTKYSSLVVGNPSLVKGLTSITVSGVSSHLTCPNGSVVKAGKLSIKQILLGGSSPSIGLPKLSTRVIRLSPIGVGSNFNCSNSSIIKAGSIKVVQGSPVISTPSLGIPKIWLSGLRFSIAAINRSPQVGVPGLGIGPIKLIATTRSSILKYYSPTINFGIVRVTSGKVIEYDSVGEPSLYIGKISLVSKPYSRDTKNILNAPVLSIGTLRILAAANMSVTKAGKPYVISAGKIIAVITGVNIKTTATVASNSTVILGNVLLNIPMSLSGLKPTSKPKITIGKKRLKRTQFGSIVYANGRNLMRVAYQNYNKTTSSEEVSNN